MFPHIFFIFFSARKNHWRNIFKKKRGRLAKIKKSLILYPERKRKMETQFTMRQVCEQTGLTYETLKFYCNEGLVPNVKRGENNYRIFDERDVAWVKSLDCLKNCNMSIAEMKKYLALCLAGESTIPERKKMLAAKRAQLLEKIQVLKDSVAYIDWKNGFYDDVLAGRTKYVSNLSKSGIDD